MRPKLIFLDLEGTLVRIPPIESETDVAQSAWTILAEMLGPECLFEEEETKRKWEAKAYFNYVEWMEDTIRIHKKYGLNRRVFSALLDRIEEMPGIRQAAKSFHEWGAKIAIVSGGFKALADKAQIAMKAHHALAACEYFFGDDGLVSHWNLLPSDYEGKLDFMRLLIREYGFKEQECVFVGDGNNDVPLAASVGFSIAFNAQSLLKEIATASIDQSQGKEDFLAVADLIDRLMR
jgi:phosphoserine phosphatase